jgi:hypothetical protein
MDMVHGGSQMVSLPNNHRGILLHPQSSLTVEIPQPKVYLSFFKHNWSGIAEISVNGAPVASIDLFDPNEIFQTLEIDMSHGTELRIASSGKASEKAAGTEVIIGSIQVAAQEIPGTDKFYRQSNK